MQESPLRTISVIIPAWGEDSRVGPLCASLLAVPEVREVIVAAAVPHPALAVELAAIGARMIYAGEPNRGLQQDLGAAGASGKWLLFHHADSQITAAHLAALGAVGSGIVGGAFYRRFDERHPWLRRFEPVERWHNRTFGALYGDQSLFVRREVFAKLGGFRGLPLMEDVDFSRRLRRHGRIALLDPPISSSPRKHLAQGPWRTTFTNAWLLALYHLGVSPRRLHAWYYRRPVTDGIISNTALSKTATVSTHP